MSIIEPTYIEIGWDNENSDEHLQKYVYCNIAFNVFYSKIRV